MSKGTSRTKSKRKGHRIVSKDKRVQKKADRPVVVSSVLTMAMRLCASNDCPTMRPNDAICDNTVESKERREIAVSLM